MGASQFGDRVKGKTPNEAFKAAQEAARYEYGHRGYTGTIAEKHSFTLISVPDGEDPIRFADNILDKDDPRVRDKWGPAGCVKIADGEFYFFGWASS